MKANDLKLLIDSGAKPVVTFTRDIEIQEGYLEEGMRGRVTGAYFDDDDILVFQVALEEFVAFNVVKEKANYFDKNHNPCLTATQAGCALSEDSVWTAVDKDVACELVEDARTKLFENYRATGATCSYLQWLEDTLLGSQLKAAA